jgi:hypothetical protein
VGLELFPRPKSSGVLEFSQAGKAQFTPHANNLNSATYGTSIKNSAKVFHCPAHLRYP